MTIRAWVLAVLTMLPATRWAAAANSVVVESKTVALGEQDITIGIRVTNDVTLSGVAVPLALRTVSGDAFITTLQMSFAERLAPAGVLDSRDRNLYAAEDGTCHAGPGGFGTISFSGGLPFPVAASPEGVLMVAVKVGGSALAPGSDATGSMVLTADIRSENGTFEIDTTCTNPNNHLGFVEDGVFTLFPPAFTTGLIAVGSTVVTNLNDAGPGSLRAALSYADTSSAADTILFAVAGVIPVLTPLPPVADTAFPMLIDGFSAPGAGPGLRPTVIIDGSLCPTGPGFEVFTTSNVIRGLTIREFPGAGVLVSSGAFNIISECRIHSNGGIGIDLIGGPGVDPNDPGDADLGSNFLANYPTIDTALLLGPDSFYVAGATSPYAMVELYLAELYLGGQPAHPSGHGDAWDHVGTTMASPAGHFAFPALKTRAWSYLTAITIDTAGNTSEFAANRQLVPDSLIVTGYSPVVLTVITPDGLDSIGRDIITGGFNTIGPTAIYDSLTDYSDPLDGDPDDRVIITNIEPGEYTIRVTTKPGGEGEGYVLGIRVDGTNEAYAAVSGGMSSTPVENPVPLPGESDTFTFAAEPAARGDLDGSGFLDAVDLAILIDLVFFGANPPNPADLADINCDTFPDAVDLALLIDFVFFGGAAPCP
ncbi:MAG: hypothetical protein AB1752_11580 [Candidatus Zixiibacteriota bacterium]